MRAAYSAWVTSYFPSQKSCISVTWERPRRKEPALIKTMLVIGTTDAVAKEASELFCRLQAARKAAHSKTARIAKGARSLAFIWEINPQLGDVRFYSDHFFLTARPADPHCVALIAQPENLRGAILGP